MKTKIKSLSTIHKGKAMVEEMDKKNKFAFDYGPMSLLPVFLILIL